MFDKNKFALILKNISKTYDNQRDFAEKSNINRTYLSKYMNMKLEKAPKPEILAKLSNASHGITTYEELMIVCGHIDENDYNSYLFGLLGFSHDDMKNFYNSLDMLKMTKNEEEILTSILKKILSNSEDTNLKNIDYSKYPTTTRKKIISALNLYSEYLEKIRNFSKIMSSKDKEKRNRIINIPVLGKIAAGQPIFAEQYIEGYLPVDPDIYGLNSSEDYFYLKVSGNSMNKKVKNGDYALIQKQNYADDGDIIVAIINSDEEATLKKYKKINNNLIALEPQSNDPSYETIYIDKNTPFQIIGKAIGQFGKF